MEDMATAMPLAEDQTGTQQEDVKRAREFYRYLQPDNLVHPSTRRRGSTFDIHNQHVPSLSAALAPFCQLVALRLRTCKAMLNVMDRDMMYFLAEASISQEQSTEGQPFEFTEDPIMMTCSAIPLKGRVCEMTIRMDQDERDSGVPFFIIPDLTTSIFADLAVVAGPPYYRFYAGTPITTRDGINIGSIAVMDTKPRAGLHKSEETFLAQTAEQIMIYLETNRQAIEGRRTKRLGEGLEYFIAGKKSLSDDRGDCRAETIKKKSRPSAYGMNSSIGQQPNGDDKIAPQMPSNASRLRGASLDSIGSEVSTSEHSTDSEQPQKDDDSQSRSHSRTFARAANLLREAFDELGEDGSVVFLNLKNRLDRCSVSMSTSPSQSRPSNSTTRNNLRSPTDGNFLLPDPAVVLASSSLSMPFGTDEGQLAPNTSLSDDTLRELMKRYPAGKLWTFDDGMSSSSEEEQVTNNRSKFEQPKRNSRRKKLEQRELKLAFPSARQLLFAPVWDPDIGAFAHACFISASLDTRSLSVATELPFLNSFCSTVMAECSRLDTMRADKQKSDFVGTISHEMRSPLHGILASVEFLAETELNGFQQSLIDTVDSCGRTLLDTINHVLDFSKINSFQKQWQAGNKRSSHLGRKRHHLGSGSMSKPYTNGAPPLLQLTGMTDISAVLEEVVEGLVLGQTFTSGLDMTDLSRESRGRGVGDSKKGAQVLKREDVQVIIDVEQADWHFMTQPGAVRRIVLNLTGNALKYTAVGTITVGLELKAKSEEDKDNETMILTVADTGRGISRQFLNSRLFTPFAQENALAPGTGLGLSIVNSIVTMLGGTIEVKSEVGKGTTVQVILPLKRPLPGQTSTANTPHSGGTAMSSASSPDESITLLQNQASDTRVTFYRPRASPDDNLARTISRYVKNWYGLELVDQQLLDSANLILTEEDDLESLLNENPGTPRSQPTLVVLCGVTSRHSAAYIASLESRIGGAVEFVGKPVGPYKLAKSIRLALQKVRVIKPQFRDVATMSTLREQATPLSPKSARPTMDPEMENLGDDLHELDLSGGREQDVQQVVQASETIAVSQTSQNAQRAMISPTSGVYATGPKYEEEKGFPFPEQNGHAAHSLDAAVHKDELPPIMYRANAERRDSRRTSRQTSLNTDKGNSIVKVNPKVLLVDDNKINLKLLETFLKKKREYTKVDMADDGQKAVDAYVKASATEGYDMIFMDISMPVMNGFEATRVIRGLEKETDVQGSGVMVIALTGLASGRDQAEGFESGIDIYLTKPVSFKEVGKLLDNWEAHERLREYVPLDENGDVLNGDVPHGASAIAGTV